MSFRALPVYPVFFFRTKSQIVRRKNNDKTKKFAVTKIIKKTHRSNIIATAFRLRAIKDPDYRVTFNEGRLHHLTSNRFMLSPNLYAIFPNAKKLNPFSVDWNRYVKY